ncbi:MAG: DNA-3-methyladenine glycosylase 2 [Thermoplasmata archaeon]|uniref:DNA-(apurinic or apyrimidinic site) lyase n=1 Tax=Candidatus Sysuiplasma superficiale TaxID=2823368 RepID=A0A8J8CC98_9ARCH|nr:DNA-3-methyladenine glycosylase 2 [Candidatus Sysuiplasma superficiale]
MRRYTGHHTGREPAEEHKGAEISVAVSQPFDLRLSVECGQAFRWNRIGENYYCVLGRRILKIRQHGRTLKASLSPDTGFFGVLGLIGDVFRFDDDIDSIIHEISVDKIIAEAVMRYRGLRIIRQDPWECLVSYLCSINSNIPRIRKDVERLSDAFGEEITFDGLKFSTFPTVSSLAEASETELRKLRLGFRAKYISSAARRIRDEGVDLLSLRRMGYEEAFNLLTEFDGVGPKVADCVLLFSLDKLEAFPVDRWVKRAVEILYFDGREMPASRVREWASEHFGAYAGYAQEYLFYGSRLREIVASAPGSRPETPLPELV